MTGEQHSPGANRQPDVSCGQCRTPRPTGARFCPTCGTDFLAPIAAASGVSGTPRRGTSKASNWRQLGSIAGELDMLDLERPQDQSAGHTATGEVSGGLNGGTKGALRLIMTVGAALLAVVIGWSLLSGSSTDEAATTERLADSGTPVEAESDTGEMADNTDADTSNTAAPQRDSDNNDLTSASGIAEGQSATQTPPGAADAVDVLEADLASLNLPGFLIQTSSSGIRTLDLSTGKRVELFDEDLPNAVATVDGALCCGSPSTIRVEPQDDWMLHPWDGSEPTTIELADGETVRAAVQDPDAGLLVIVGQSSESIFGGGLVSGYAIRVDTGERKRVELHESQPYAIPALWGDQVGTNLLANINDKIYTWRWEAGWEVLSEGLLRSVGKAHFVSDQCTSPAECTRTLLDSTGSSLGELPSDLFVLGSNLSTLSPDGRYLTTESFDETGPYVQLVEVATGETRIVNVGGSPSTSFSTAATWVTSDYLAVAGRLGRYALVDVRTNEPVDLPDLRNNQVILTWLPDEAIPRG